MTGNGPGQSSDGDLVFELGWSIGFDSACPIRTRTAERILIGAAPHCDIRVADCGVPILGYVDEQDLLIVLSDEPWVFINGRRANKTLVTAGCFMMIGETRITWHRVEKSAWRTLVPDPVPQPNNEQPPTDSAQHEPSVPFEHVMTTPIHAEPEVTEVLPTSVEEHDHRRRPRVAPPTRRGVALGRVLSTLLDDSAIQSIPFRSDAA